MEHPDALAFLRGWLRSHDGGRQLAAVGHRVVHGGARHATPRRMDAGLMAELEALVPLAPLHQPHNLALSLCVQPGFGLGLFLGARELGH
jgi:acetate kinase